jgi:ABC-type uncharacterized transport system auxiliary subunit
MILLRQIIASSSGPLSEMRCTTTCSGSRLLAPSFEGWRTLLRVAAAFLSILIVGCGATRPAKYHQLTIPTDNASDPPSEVFPVTILMGPLMSSHLYREDHIVYSSGGENMGTYEYQRWAEPPTEMIQEVLFRALRSSGRYRAVYAQRSSIRGDYLLHGHLYDFKEVTGASMSARLALELELRDTKTGDTVWTHLYSHDEPVSGKDVSAVVASLNRNVHRATNEFTASLIQYFSAHPPASPPSPTQ